MLMDLVGELRFEKSYRGVERLVQLVIQALLDLGVMLIAALGARKPASYRDVANVLEELGVLPREEAHLLRLMAGLRNVLVHAYARVDRDIVTRAAEDLLSDAPRIAQLMLRRAEGIPDPPRQMGLDEELLVKLRRVLKGQVKAAFLFGGRAKGYALRGDVDVAVLLGRPYGPYDLGSLVVNIADALGVNEELIDLVVLDKAPPELILEALEGVPVLVEDAMAVFELRTKALREYLDLREAMRLTGS